MQQVAQLGEVDYIPADLDDCFEHLKLLIPARALADMVASSEKAMASYHLTIGMQLRNRWGLWSGSRLAQWFNTIGIYHADDMSGIILTSFWRHLNEVPINLDGQVQFYLDYWKGAEQWR